jgi:hypothetical protein
VLLVERRKSGDAESQSVLVDGGTGQRADGAQPRSRESARWALLEKQNQELQRQLNEQKHTLSWLSANQPANPQQQHPQQHPEHPQQEQPRPSSCLASRSNATANASEKSPSSLGTEFDSGEEVPRLITGGHLGAQQRAAGGKRAGTMESGGEVLLIGVGFLLHFAEHPGCACEAAMGCEAKRCESSENRLMGAVGSA